MTHADAMAALLDLEAADPHLRVYRVTLPGGSGSMPLRNSHPSVADGQPGYVTHDGQEFTL